MSHGISVLSDEPVIGSVRTIYKMRFRGAGVRVFKSLLVLGVLAGVVVGFLMLTPYGPATETFVEIAPGTGTAAIARQ